MKDTKRNFIREERGVEPTVMKILVGIILVSIGLGVGVTMYRRIGGQAQNYLDYDVTATPGSATLHPENSIDVDVTVSTNVDFDEQVLLDASGVPEGVIIEFNPSSGTPTFGSTMNIEVEGTALSDNEDSFTQTITIKGETTEGNEKTATFELTITE